MTNIIWISGLRRTHHPGFNAPSPSPALPPRWGIESLEDPGSIRKENQSSKGRWDRATAPLLPHVLLRASCSRRRLLAYYKPKDMVRLDCFNIAWLLDIKFFILFFFLVYFVLIIREYDFREFKIPDLLEFNSKSKRMIVISQDQDDQILLFLQRSRHIGFVPYF